MRGVGGAYYQEKAELPSIKEALPEYAKVNAQILQDVALRVARAFQAFFQRIQAGETPGYPAFRSATATIASSTHKSATTTAARGWITPFSSCRKSDAALCAGLAHWKVRPRPLLNCVRQMGGMSAYPAPACPRNRSPPLDEKSA
jgi:putative transposase